MSSKSRSTEDAFNSIHRHVTAMIDAMDEDILLANLREDFDEKTAQDALERFKDALYAMRWEPHRKRSTR